MLWVVTPFLLFALQHQCSRSLFLQIILFIIPELKLQNKTVSFLYFERVHYFHFCFFFVFPFTDISNNLMHKQPLYDISHQAFMHLAPDAEKVKTLWRVAPSTRCTARSTVNWRVRNAMRSRVVSWVNASDVSAPRWEFSSVFLALWASRYFIKISSMPYPLPPSSSAASSNFVIIKATQKSSVGKVIQQKMKEASFMEA